MTDLISRPDDRQTMTSLELSKLSRVRPDNVKRTIESLAKDGLVAFTQSEEKVTGGRPRVVYRVGERDSYVVMARLSPEFTAQLVDRWRELEASAVATHAPILDTTPRHSVLAMWQPLNGGKGKLPKKVVQDLEVMRRGYPTAVERDRAHDDYLVAAFLAVGLVEHLCQHREDKLGLLKDGLETPDETWQAFVEARDQLRAEYHRTDGVAGLLH